MVATVAFGMGLDAMHVRSIIHLTMPRSLEEYVQQARLSAKSPTSICLESAMCIYLPLKFAFTLLHLCVSFRSICEASIH